MHRLPPPITSRTNAHVKALRAAFSGRASEPGELVGIEGWKSITEAQQAGLRLATLAVTTAAAGRLTPEQLARSEPRELLVLSEEVMASVADTVAPSGTLASVAIPAERAKSPLTGIYLLLEAIQDPGNLGTLIRSAEAFGVERLILLPGCANPWSPKVIRSSAGSVFRQAISRRPLGTAVQELRSAGVRLVGAVARGAGARVSLDADLTAPLGVAIGNEGSGLSVELLEQTRERVYIPCVTESLNAAVAGSVLLYGILEQNRGRSTPPKQVPDEAGAHGTV